LHISVRLVTGNRPLVSHVVGRYICDLGKTFGLVIWSGHHQVVCTWTSDCLRMGKTSWYITRGHSFPLTIFPNSAG